MVTQCDGWVRYSVQVGDHYIDVGVKLQVVSDPIPGIKQVEAQGEGYEEEPHNSEIRNDKCYWQTLTKMQH